MQNGTEDANRFPHESDSLIESLRATAPNPSHLDGTVRSQLLQWQLPTGKATRIEPAEPPLSCHIGDNVRPTLHKDFPMAKGEGEGEDGDTEDLTAKGPPDIADEDTSNFSISSDSEWGDLIALPQTSLGEPFLGIYAGIARSGHARYLLANGTVARLSPGAQMYKVKAFVHPSDLAPLEPYLWEDPGSTADDRIIHIPPQVSDSLTGRIRQFKDSSAAFYRKHARRFDNAHELVAHEIDTTVYTIEDFIEFLTGEPPLEHGGYAPHQIFACYHALNDTSGFGFTYLEQLSYEVITVFSKKTTRVSERVTRWVQAYREAESYRVNDFFIPRRLREDGQVMVGFLRKMSSILQQKRSEGVEDHFRFATHHILDESDVNGDRNAMPVIEFTPNEQDIIYFLKLQACTRFSQTKRSTFAIASAIMRAVKGYKEENADSKTLASFLEVVGIMPSFTPRLAIDAFVDLLPSQLRDTLAIFEDRIDSGEAVQDVFQLKDSMSKLRKDWEELPVFCIDGNHTKQRDDGISIEAATDSPGQYWIHVHISHISAFITPGDVVDQCASHRQENLYLASGQTPMIPESVWKVFSISPDAPVLTFSTKVDPNGHASDFRIQPGIVRNVHFLSTEEALAATEDMDCLEEFVMDPLPHDVKLAKRVLTVEDRTSLKLLMDISTKTHYFQLQSYLKAFPAGGVDMKLMHEKRPQAQFLKAPSENLPPQPIPRISMRPYSIFMRDSDEKLAEASFVHGCMHLASKGFGEWAAGKKLAVPYTGLVPASSEVASITVQEVHNHIVDGIKTGITGPECNQLRKCWGTNQVGSSPIPHMSLELEAYAKVTSPLRRYTDILAHWQIDAYLRAERRGAEGLEDLSSQPWLPFSSASLNRALRLSRTRTIGQLYYRRWDAATWPAVWLARALYSDNSLLPERFTVVIEHIWKHDQMRTGKLVEGGLNAELDTSIGEDGNEATIRDVWEVKVLGVDIQFCRALVKPLRRIESGKEVLAKRLVNSSILWKKWATKHMVY